MQQTSATAVVRPSLIVGLGNPGPQYARTRHNIGFEALDSLARHWHLPLSAHRRFQGEFSEGTVFGQRVYLLKPLTYMNNSGRSIRTTLDWYKLSPQSLLVIYDDLDLPVGKLRIRLSGSAGGHNGMRSTITHIGTQEFPRLRIGIDNPQTKNSEMPKDAIPHVLGRFTPAEKQILPAVLDLVLEAVEISLKQGVEKSMSLYNSRTVAPSRISQGQAI